MEPITFLTVSQGVSAALGAVRQARDLLKSDGTDMTGIKEQLNTAYDSLLESKEQMIAFQDENRRLQEENRALLERLNAKESITPPKDPFGYRFKVGEDMPLCPRCYDDSGKVVYLPAPNNWNKGLRRDCRVCKQTYWEKEMSLGNGGIVPRIRPYGSR